MLFSTPPRTTILVVPLCVLLAGCSDVIIPKDSADYGSRTNDSCQDCGPGLFSGEDGVISLYGGEEGGVLDGLVQPASTRSGGAISDAEAAARVREAERRAEEAERRAAAAEARARRLERQRQARPYDPAEAEPGYSVQLSPELGTYFE